MANEVRIDVTSRDRSGPGFTSARKRADGLRDSTRRIGEIAAGIVASGVFERIASSAQRAFTDSIRAASGLEQAVGGTEAVFGSAGDTIDDFADRSAEAVGLSERQFREATTLIGGQLKRMTGDVNLAADASIDLVEVGADLAATYGGTTKEAVDAFAAALRGEADPAERFNLNLKISQQNAKAVELGLAASTSEVDENARAQALLALIMEQSADAQGQFARESDTAAGSQQRLNAQIEDTQAELGQNFLPVLGAAGDFLFNVLEGFQALPGPVQLVTTLLIGTATAAAAGATALRALGISLTTVKTALGPIGIALAIGGAIIAGLAALGSESKQASGNVDGLAQTLERGTGAITSATREAVLLELQQKGLAQTSRDLGLAVEDVVAAYLGEDEALRRVNDALDQAIKDGTTQERVWKSRKEGISEVVDVQNDEAQAAQRLKDAIAAGNLTTEQAVELAKELGVVTGETGDVVTEAAEAAQKSAEAAGELANAWDDAVSDITDANAALSDANSELEEDQELTTAAFIEQFDKRVQAANDFNANIVAIQRKTSAEVFALMEEDLQNNPELAALIAKATGEEFDQIVGLYKDSAVAANDAANREFVNNIPSLQKIADESGQEFAENVADAIRKGGSLTTSQVNKIMRSVKNDIEGTELLAVIESALDEGDRRTVEDRLNFLARTRTASIAVTGAVGNLFAGRAAGGIVGSEFDSTAQAGGPRSSRVLVGEQRAEVVDLPIGSRVIPSVDQAMDRNQVNGNGGVQELRVVLDLEGAEDAFVEAFRQALRVRGEQLGSPA